MEEDVGNAVTLNIVAALHVGALSRSEANGDDLSSALLNELLVGLLNNVEGLGNESVVLLEVGALVARQAEGLSAGGAGDDLLGGVDSEEDLEVQVKHVGSQLGGGERRGTGVRLGLLEDVGEGVESLLGVEDGSVVESVAHDGRLFECRVV